MFLDLDKPVLKDPREVMEAAMEWESVSNMYARRDESYARTGFLEDLHEARTLEMDPTTTTGRYRYLPGFNPPRRIVETGYDDIPTEIKSMIMESMGGITERTHTRMISRTHSTFTKSLDEIVSDAVSDVTTSQPSRRPIVPLMFARDYTKDGDVSIAGQTLRLVMEAVLTKLGLPLKVLPLNMMGCVMSIASMKEGKDHDKTEQEINLGWNLSVDAVYLRAEFRNHCYDKDWKRTLPIFWKHYPIIRAVLKSIPRHVKDISDVRTQEVDKEYDKFKSKALKRGFQVKEKRI